ncbi:MAG: hypothetical protein K6G55_04545 [Selenomonadaceae bacterium]|nr:hypothetical protein [Selenomonadaceae bacterium]
MNQTTKTVTKIKVSSEKMNEYKEAKIDSLIADVAQQVSRYATVLIEWANRLPKNSLIYMYSKDVYYFPEIVGVMPNLENFNKTCQCCDNSSFNAPPVEKMKFGGFEGDFPTADEAKKCFADSGRYFRNDNFIRVNGTNHDGVTCKYRNDFACYNVYRGGIIQKYGNGNGGDYGWNIPIYRFNGKDSSPVSLGQSILFWRQYDLYPEQFEKDKNLTSAYDALKKYGDYLIANEQTILLDTSRVKADIYSGKELSWMPKETQEILKTNVLNVNKELTDKFREKLLRCDKQAIALDPYDEKFLTDPNRGHWDLWDLEGAEGEDNLLIDLGEGLTARNPVADVSDGIVAIDFGTKSTVVVYETNELQVLPLQVGSGTYSKGLQAKNYENPTVLQFIDLDSFLAHYTAKEGRPDTSWDEVTVSHNAFQNLKDSSSERHNTFFEGLKQWCGTSGQRLKLQDAKGKIWELPAFMELSEQDMDPLEIYAYYLGRYINHMLQGKIFLHYVMSFPVTYEHRIREHMGNSIRKGLKKSFPTALLADEEVMKKFCVLEVASEPAAYAISALQEYNFAPEGVEQIYYAVFDFGGGTTDFDFGMFKESDDDRYDYVLTHFGENGDRTLGGENLLQLLAFEVFRANKDYLLNPDGNTDGNAVGSQIPFALATDAKLFAGYESLLKNSREAQQNMRNLMEKLRPVWEEPESKEAKEIISAGQIQLTLYRENGEKKTDANLKLKINQTVVDLQAILKNRIEQGVRRFFTSLAEAFDKSARSDSRIAALSDVKKIFVFLAGNSSRSTLVKELFDEYLGKNNSQSDNDTAEIETQPSQTENVNNKDSSGAEKKKAEEPCEARKLLRFGNNQSMPEFIVLPPLGTKEANEIRKAKMGDIEDTRELMMRPTGKTGVAYGLLKCRDGGEIKVETITPDGERVPFQYYIGRRKKGKFKLVIDRNAKLKTWYKFIDAGGSFDILYTDRPEAAAGDAPMTIAKQKHINVENPDKTAFVYIRPAESRVIEYMIAHDEAELATGNENKCDPKRIELE